MHEAREVQDPGVQLRELAEEIACWQSLPPGEDAIKRAQSLIRESRRATTSSTLRRCISSVGSEVDHLVAAQMRGESIVAIVRNLPNRIDRCLRQLAAEDPADESRPGATALAPAA
jgi:hypothetical protein